MVDTDSFESSRDFNTDHPGYITRTFEDTSYYILHIWEIQNYKEVTGFIKKLCVCGMDVISLEDIITYESLVQDYMREYRNIVDSNQWKPTDSKENYQDEPLLLKTSTVSIEDPFNKTIEKMYFKIRHNGK